MSFIIPIVRLLKKSSLLLRLWSVLTKSPTLPFTASLAVVKLFLKLVTNAMVLVLIPAKSFFHASLKRPTVTVSGKRTLNIFKDPVLNRPPMSLKDLPKVKSIKLRPDSADVALRATPTNTSKAPPIAVPMTANLASAGLFAIRLRTTSQSFNRPPTAFSIGFIMATKAPPIVSAMFCNSSSGIANT